MIVCHKCHKKLEYIPVNALRLVSCLKKLDSVSNSIKRVGIKEYRYMYGMYTCLLKNTVLYTCNAMLPPELLNTSCIRACTQTVKAGIKLRKVCVLIKSILYCATD